jgi:hypothetical protein
MGGQGAAPQAQGTAPQAATAGAPQAQGTLFDRLPPKGRQAAIAGAQGIVNGAQQLQSIDGQLANIDTLVGPFSIGVGSLSAGIPGSPAANLHAALETLRSQGLLTWIQSLKSASANGNTGIGRVLQSEANAAMQAYGSLDQHQSEDQFRYHMSIFAHRVHQLQSNAEAAFKQQYGVDPYSALGVQGPGVTGPSAGGWSVVGVR